MCMPCKRCGGRLEKFELQGRISTVCEDCGSLNVLVEHEPPEQPSESWSDAIERFNEQQETTEVTVETLEDTEHLSPASSDD
jgi:predicted ATP-dependent serine protease